MALLCARCLEPVRPVNECVCDDTEPETTPDDDEDEAA